MITLKALTESIVKQIKPNLTDDVEISEEWIKRIIHDSRAALITKKMVAGELFNNYYQEMDVKTTTYSGQSFDGMFIPANVQYEIAVIPTLLHRAGKKAIDYFGTFDMSSLMIDYVELNEFIAYGMHRFGSGITAYTTRSNSIMIRNANGQQKYRLRALFAVPTEVPNYDEELTAYPIDESDIRSLEIITFQHIAPKLGLPVDLINNGQDETKNAPVTQQVKQAQVEE